MSARLLLLAPILTAGCILTSSKSVITKRDPGFELAQLARERVAVWPVAAANVDPAAAEGVTKQYGSEAAFLDSLGRTISGRLVRSGGTASLSSDQLVAKLGAADATRALLDSRHVLGAGADNRFSGPSREVASLRSLPPLEGIRYAILLPSFSVEREQVVTGGPHDGARTIAWARGRLHLAVADLGRGTVVWEGDLAASGTLTSSGMKQIEQGLGTALDEAMSIFPAKATPVGPERCETTADCGRGVCISGLCR